MSAVHLTNQSETGSSGSVFIFDLSPCVILSLLSEWIDLPGLLSLDEALWCVPYIHKTFLWNIQDTSFVLTIARHGVLSNQRELNWICERRVGTEVFTCWALLLLNFSRTLLYLKEKGQYIKNINLNGEKAICSAVQLKSIIKQCPNLQVIRNLHVESLTKHATTAIHGLKNYLRCITFCCNYLGSGLNESQVNKLRELFESPGGFPALEYVRVPTPTWFRQQNLMLCAVVGACPSLRHLDSAGPWPSPADDVETYSALYTAIGRCCQYFEELYLPPALYGHMTNRDLQILAKGCPRLTNIELQRCYRVSTPGLVSYIEQSPQLKSILLTNDGYLDMDPVLNSISANCRNLEELWLGSERQLTETALIEVFTSCKKLREVDLVDSRQISDRALIALADSCPNLEVISVDGCPGITDAGIIALSGGCPKLIEVHMNDLDGLTDAAVIHIAMHHPLLERIFFRGNEGISSTSLEMLTQHCHLLQIVSTDLNEPIVPTCKAPIRVDEFGNEIHSRSG